MLSKKEIVGALMMSPLYWTLSLPCRREMVRWIAREDGKMEARRPPTLMEIMNHTRGEQAAAPL